MASTQSGKPAPNFGRRIKWLGIVAACGAALYSAGWYWLANEGERRIDAAIALSAEYGRVGECVNRDIRGYPFRIGLFCDRVAYSDDERGIVFNAGALRSAAQVYNPKHAVIELDGPAFIETQDVPPLELNWSLLHASVRADMPVPQQVSIEGKGVTASYDGAQALGADLATFHMRKEDANAAFAGDWHAVMIAPGLTPGRAIPQFSLAYDAVVEDGVRLIAEKARSARGQSAQLRSLNLTFAGGGSVTASGPLSVNANGLLSGSVKLTFADAGKLAKALALAIPEAASAIGPALTAAEMAAGAGKEASLDLTIRDGKIYAGLFPLGDIPPLQ